ncbi:S-layer homology domain-containing protein [Halobacillus sp. K22]|uniref:S-layer homology domain-containing protein n=1 Tax=Halobacillus sp. K22 TaxID=3457431 RepID=UPI003FCD0B44
MKKVLLSVFVLVLALTSMVSTAFAEDDITGTPFEDDLRALIESGIMNGYNDGTYRPSNSVTRAEFTVFLNGALDLKMGDGELPEEHFTDVEPDDWYFESVMIAYNNGLVNGYPNGDFQPNKVISRQDMAMMMVNAAKAKNVVSERKPLAFADNEEISDYAVESVERLTYLEIISGKQNQDGTLFFAPKDETSRGETAAVINRLMNVLEPPKELDYKVVSLSEDEDPVVEEDYETYEEAVSNADDDQVVLKGNNIVWMNEGLAVSNAYTVLYDSSDLSRSLTYMTSGVEVELLEINEDTLKIKLADTTAYVDADKINLTPQHMVKDRSYYYEKNGDLYHRIYNSLTEGSAAYKYGAAPSFMKNGEKYYSYNGSTFFSEDGSKAGEAHQYFNRMPLYTETSYTGAQLDEFIASEVPDSPLIGTGDAFKKAEELHGTNALYLLAHAIHESNWGKSKIARDKNNLFGIGANDGNPYEDAWTYESYEKGILVAASEFIVPGYFDSSTWKARGAHLGNKSSGMNVYYASDVYWGQKIAGHMYRADSYLSSKYGTPKENAAYDLAETITSYVNVRAEADAGAEKLYTLPKAGETVQILSETDGLGTWYQISPKSIESTTYENAFVYSHGYSSYGNSLRKLPLSK